MKPMIDQAFWSDPDIEAAKAGVKLAALWLITNSQTSLIGLCGASTSRFVFETGLSADALESALKALPRAFKRFGGIIFVRNYVRHQFGSGEKLIRNNFFVALRSLFLSVKDADLNAEILREYPEFDEARKGFEGLTKPKDVKERKGKEEGKGSAEGKPRRQKSEPAPMPEPPPPLNTEAFAAAWGAYVAYRAEARLKPLKPSSVAQRFAEMAAWGEKRAVAAINFSIANAYQGIFEPNEKRTGTHQNGATGRNANLNANVDYTHRPVRPPKATQWVEGQGG